MSLLLPCFHPYGVAYLSTQSETVNMSFKAPPSVSCTQLPVTHKGCINININNIKH